MDRQRSDRKAPEAISKLSLGGAFLDDDSVAPKPTLQ
jgi:hypothetical protein